MASIVNSSASIASGGSFTPGAGSNRLAVLIAAYTYTTATRYLTAVTLGGVSATQVVSVISAAAQFCYSDIWIIPEASMPSGASTLSPTFNGGTPTTQRWAAYTLADCDQSDFSVFNSAVGTTVTSLNTTFTSTDTSVLIAGVTLVHNASNTNITWSGATELAGSDTTHGAPNMRRAVASSTIATGASESVTASWTAGVNAAQTMALFKNFAAAAGGQPARRRWGGVPGMRSGSAW